MKGAVAAGVASTADAAADILAAGGNAVDAAIAAVCAAWVAELFFTAPGGGGVALVREPGGFATALDGFAAMPGLGSKRTPSEQKSAGMLDFREKVLQYGEAELRFNVGRGSVAVPGLVALLDHMHARWGTIPMPELLEPALQLARAKANFPAAHIEISSVLEPIMVDTPECAALFGGAEAYMVDPSAVDLGPMQDLLEMFRREGLRSLYTGDLAERIVADQTANGGLITARDLAEFRVRESEPVRVDLGDWMALVPPRPSRGGVMIARMLGLWRALAEHEPAPAPGTADDAHRWAVVIASVNAAVGWSTMEDEGPEAEKAHGSVESGGAVGDEALSEEALSDDPSDVHDLVEHLLPGALAAVRERRAAPDGVQVTGRGSTTHVSVIDEHGMAVSLTASAGETAGYLVPGTGLMLNNMLGEADLFPGGFHSASAGTPLSTMMSPTLMVRGLSADDAASGESLPDDQVAVGSGGSARIRTALSEIARLIVDGASVKHAVDHPRVHVEEGTLHLEPGYGAGAPDALRAMGWRVQLWRSRSGFFGGANAARWADGGVHAEAAGDPRRNGAGRVVG